MYIKNIQLIQEVRKVYKGKRIIDNITQKYQVNKNMDFVVVLTKDSLEVSVCLLLYLNLLVKQFEVNKNKLEKMGRPILRENEKFIILTDDSRIGEDAKLIFPRLTNCVQLSKEEMEAVIKRYTYMPVDNRFIMGTMNVNGRCGKDIASCSNVSEEEIIARSILGIEKKYYKKWKLPIWNLEMVINQEIKDCILRLTDKGNRNYEAEASAVIG